MRPLIQEIATAHTPESLIEQLRGVSGVVLLRSALFDSSPARYSFVAAQPTAAARATATTAKRVIIDMVGLSFDSRT